METYSDTEQLILSYLRAHRPEECMLDKISKGTGKSRATVLKYLGILHARGLLEYMFVGRSKLWKIKEGAGAGEQAAPAAAPAGEEQDLAVLAFALYEARRQEATLADRLALPETIVLTVTEDLRILAANRLFASLFPEARSLRDLLRQTDETRVEGALQSVKAGRTATVDLDLLEKAGVYRPYAVTLVPPPAAGPARCVAVIGEDLSGRRRTKRDLEALLYIIRSVGTAPDEEHLLEGTMMGIREKLVPYLHAAVFTPGGHPAYATFEPSADRLVAVTPLVRKSMENLETATTGPLALPGIEGEVKSALAVPIIEEEEATGAVLLLLGSEASATLVESLEIVADELASALKMQRLDRERSEYVNTLLALNRLSGILNEAHDEASMLERSIEAVMGALGFEMGCVYLVDEADEMVPRVQRNMPESLRQMCLSGVFDALFERAFAEQKVVYITPETPAYAALDEAVRAQGVKTILIMPIKIGDEVVGLLNMGSDREKRYMRTSLENLSSIGLQLGLALERSRLARELAARG